MSSPETGASKERIEFKAETAQVLNLVINSLYSHREVFLRELISNAADAIDKHRHLTMTDENYKKPDEPYAIRITADREKKTLTLSDNGIGMSREEIISHLGTIASSGTRAFLESLGKEKKSAPELIGQFGVGFYSAFMAASRVRVISLRAGQAGPAVRWESDGAGGYTLEETEKKSHGTEITLELKEDAAEFLDAWTIKSVVRKYSDYVSHPIVLKNEKGEDETLNQATAIWRRPKSEVKPEEYAEFYKYISHDAEDPLAWTHHAVEGKIEFRMLLYIPQKAPLNFYRDDMHGLRLHVKKMFITDQCRDLLPPYLRFVRGVVDSEDLPLNVSRETLQQDSAVPKIRKQLVKKVFDLFEDLAKNEPQKYLAFFKELGVALKEGLTMDFENRGRILELLRYPSSQSASADELVSLAQYVERMKPEQKEIYYISAGSREACERSPHLEFFKGKGIEVLFMTEVVDEWSTPAIGEYKGKAFKSVTQGNLDLGSLGEEARKEKEKAEGEYRQLADRVRAVLQDEVKDVRMSVRLQESPCCLVADEGDMDVKMEQIMRAMGKEPPAVKRILELNPAHPLIANLQKKLEGGAAGTVFEEWCRTLYDQALLAEGSPVKDPAGFARRVTALLAEVTGV